MASRNPSTFRSTLWKASRSSMFPSASTDKSGKSIPSSRMQAEKASAASSGSAVAAATSASDSTDSDSADSSCGYLGGRIRLAAGTGGAQKGERGKHGYRSGQATRLGFGAHEARVSGPHVMSRLGTHEHPTARSGRPERTTRPTPRHNAPPNNASTHRRPGVRPRRHASSATIGVNRSRKGIVSSSSPASNEPGPSTTRSTPSSA